jgi:acyl-CoA reductase-like NAD-dependent aldehyde dehydrogenase
VHEQVYEQVRAKLIEGAEKLNKRRGNPLDASTFLGPLIAESEAIRIEKMVDSSVATGGAKVLVGGKRDGAFFGMHATLL